MPTRRAKKYRRKMLSLEPKCLLSSILGNVYDHDKDNDNDNDNNNNNNNSNNNNKVLIGAFKIRNALTV